MACCARAVRRLAPLVPRLPVPACRAPISAGMRPLGVRGIVDAETMGKVQRVDKEHWSAFMFGRERQLLIHVVNTATEGDPTSVMKAMDSFWANTFAMEGTDSWSIRGDTIDKVVCEKNPKRALEIGTYCGYTALRIATRLPADGLLVSIDVDPLFAAIATKIIEHSGLASKVKILIGTVETQVTRISECLKVQGDAPAGPVDFVLCDHSKELFVPDLKLLEKHGAVGAGTVVVGDSTVYPGEGKAETGKQNLLAYFATHPQYRVQQHIGTQQPMAGITVSEWVHLP